jgi:transcriptional regulator with XRE-family HTH domain
MEPRQSKAARALLSWTQVELAARSGVSIGTVRAFEQGGTVPVAAIRRVIEHAFAGAGIVFINEPTRVGVTLRTRARKAAHRGFSARPRGALSR